MIAEIIKTLEKRQWSHSGGFIVNFEQISHIVLMFTLLTLNKKMPAGFPIVEYVINFWDSAKNITILSF